MQGVQAMLRIAAAIAVVAIVVVTPFRSQQGVEPTGGGGCE
jgi:hypothetical protein